MAKIISLLGGNNKKYKVAEKLAKSLSKEYNILLVDSNSNQKNGSITRQFKNYGADEFNDSNNEHDNEQNIFILPLPTKKTFRSFVKRKEIPASAILDESDIDLYFSTKKGRKNGKKRIFNLEDIAYLQLGKAKKAVDTGNFDYIIFDGPSKINALTRELANSSDWTFYVSGSEVNKEDELSSMKVINNYAKKELIQINYSESTQILEDYIVGKLPQKKEELSLRESSEINKDYTDSKNNQHDKQKISDTENKSKLPHLCVSKTQGVFDKEKYNRYARRVIPIITKDHGFKLVKNSGYSTGIMSAIMCLIFSAFIPSTINNTSINKKKTEHKSQMCLEDQTILGLRKANEELSLGEDILYLNREKIIKRISEREPYNIIKKHFISSEFGYRKSLGGGSKVHKGVDLAARIGSGIHAIQRGYAFNGGSRKNKAGYYVHVVVDNNTVDSYLHLSPKGMVVGLVERGELIAYSGNSGRSTGAHLHYERRVRNIPISLEEKIKPSEVVEDRVNNISKWKPINPRNVFRKQAEKELEKFEPTQCYKYSEDLQDFLVWRYK
ncbi:MAG TPA: M23 family metallopeptidase [Candidatus Nanoarchaeia archaeon]|nr:M23 family metallopeptidase [Candidatus Nanoarchaeia archaeon]